MSLFSPLPFHRHTLVYGSSCVHDSNKSEANIFLYFVLFCARFYLQYLSSYFTFSPLLLPPFCHTQQKKIFTMITLKLETISDTNSIKKIEYPYNVSLLWIFVFFFFFSYFDFCLICVFNLLIFAYKTRATISGQKKRSKHKREI